ncbi:flagellar hook-length control protein FliK [Rossellomorea oryzaecorticis]|uniref:Flagellar hook-length control protein FliK n=1 Tax=Rossellomorea oryzaecorticis TaxID=1396505 RepID=A0ABU9K5Q3_9BACI
MEIGLMKTVQPNETAASGLHSMKPKTPNDSFSHHLLGSLNVTAQTIALADKEVSYDLNVLSQLVGAEGLEGLELSLEQIAALKQMSELDIGMIADILGIDLTEITKLQTELQDAISSLLGKEADGETSLESLTSVLHLVQLSFTDQPKNLNRLEQLVKLSKVIELLANQKELPITESQKVIELKDMLKQLQYKVDTVMSGFTNQPRNWNEIMKAAYNRHIPTEVPGEGVQTEQNKNLQAVSGNNLHFVLPKTEQFTMTLSQAKGQIQYEQFVKELQSILSKSQMQTQPNMTKLLIKLYPEQLGSLRIELLQQNGIMTAKILATTATAKELLDSQLQGLKQAFTSQNLQVEKIEISQALSDPERQSKGQSQQQSNGQAKQSQHEPKNNEEEDSASFKEYLVNSEV